ncbi:protoporphyrinogen oxidase [Sciscionella sediminilitoris]|uniref:protoporphyrinogen oxidase n=1 Tax=Sciscionella sediminilitoris TaxID=1445613 RepID=UPI0004DF1172|nr:protoporphyrinogen oxidase [Sciscionella sp. SE31]
MRFAVVGAGITGLVAAHRLRAAGATVTVYESSERIGGKLRTAALEAATPGSSTPGDSALDLGAESFLARRPEAVRLAGELGLEVVHPGPARAVIRAGGAEHPIPAGTVMGVPATREAVREIVELTEEPAEPAAIGPQTTVGGLLRARLGDQVVDRLVDPLLAGVYAGRADALGLRATMPGLAEAIEQHGSVLAAAAALLPANPSSAPVFGAVRGGYRALTEALDRDVRTGTTVHALSRNRSGWRLGIGGHGSAEYAEADGVVLAVPAPAAAKLLAEVAPEAARGYAGIELASMAVLGFAYPETVPLPERSGILLASGERRADGTPFTAKAVTFSSRKWPHLPPGLLRASVGRFGEEELLRGTDGTLIEAVRADLAELTGITAEPAAVRVQRWGGGLPQYGPGHLERVQRIEAAVAAVPGLAVAGATLHGVGVPACIATADAAAQRLLAVG